MRLRAALELEAAFRHPEGLQTEASKGNVLLSCGVGNHVGTWMAGLRGMRTLNFRGPGSHRD
jgi:hypothetical protein